MSLPLQDRVALVTGANRGIGLEIARQLGRAGAHVLAVGRHPGLVAEAAATLRAEGFSAESRVADLTDAVSIERLAAVTPVLHVLVNNAGLIDEAVPTWEEPVAAWDEIMAVNLRAPFLLCRAFAPTLRAVGFGRIVNVSSGMGAFSDGLSGGHPAYRISKAALNALTVNLAHELAGANVLVNAMCPGWVRTRMGGDAAPRTVEQGADTALFLATLPDGGPSGQFFRDRRVIAW